MWEILIFSGFVFKKLRTLSNIIMITFFCFFSILRLKNFSLYSSFWIIDNISLFLIFLKRLIIFFCYILNKKKMILLLLRSLKLFFIRKKIVFFYIFFELSIIPAFFLIFSQGNNPERIRALYYLIVYTIIGSFPLIFFLLQNLKSLKEIINFFWKFSFFACKKTSEVVIFFLVFSFFIKLPLFGLHRWLPKAHVEAPTPGSMILAALLLKMGSYGLYRLCLSPLSMKFNSILIGWILFSLFIVSFICFRISDMKMLIAFSSINHMLAVAFRWILFSNQNLYFSVLLRVSHGFIRSGLFLLVGLFYNRTHSRKIFFKSSIQRIFSLTTLFWFVLIAANCSAPTALSLFSEIYIFGHLVEKMFSYFSIFFFVFFSGLYCIYLYMITFHGDYSFTQRNKSSLQINNLLSLIHSCYRFLLVFFLFSLF